MNQEYPIRTVLKIQRCQFGIPDESAYEDGYISDCHEPATISWKWIDQPEFYVCDKHDIEVEKSLEEAENIENNPRE